MTLAPMVKRHARREEKSVLLMLATDGVKMGIVTVVESAESATKVPEGRWGGLKREKRT